MLKTLACAAVATVASGAASAATVNETLDFTELGTGVVPTDLTTITNATLASGGDAFFVGGGQIPNSICALDTRVNSCANDLGIEFTSDVVNLTFNVGGYDPLDYVELDVYQDGFVIDTIVLTENGLVDLTGYGEVQGLFFEDDSAGAGLAYGDFQFDFAAIPLPASLPLLLGGVGMLALVRRRCVGRDPSDASRRAG